MPNEDTQAPAPPQRPEAYLGDGCYATFDGFQIWLNAPRREGTHVIALEPETYGKLLEFAAKVWPRQG